MTLPPGYVEEHQMNERQKEAAGYIIRILVDLPEKDRAQVIAAIKFNGIFCQHCGFGTIQHPNPNCQCENDE